MKQGKPDYILLGNVIVLIVLGILILSSVSAILAQEKFGTTFYFLSHQIWFGLVPGIILGFLFFKVKLPTLKKISPVFLLINLGTVGMVFLPEIGTTFRGASRSLDLGFISFQPTEFLKISFILYLSAWLAGRAEKIDSRKTKKAFNETLVVFLIVIGLISLFLILQPDIGTLGVIFLTAMAMYFSANTPIWHSVLLTIFSAGGLLILVKTASYRFDRVSVLFNPDLDPMGKSWQIKQSLIAVGSGGLLGLGLGMSRQKFGFLPHAISDSIFAVFAEETGFIGGLILIFLFLILLWRGFRIAKNSSDRFAQLAATGITTWIIVQGFINIGALIGILPLTGIPLPFISYGGSALIAELIGMGVLLNLSKTAA